MWQPKADKKDFKFKTIMIAAATRNFMNAFELPSIDDMIQIVRDAGKMTLKEVH